MPLGKIVKEISAGVWAYVTSLSGKKIVCDDEPCEGECAEGCLTCDPPCSIEPKGCLKAAFTGITPGSAANVVWSADDLDLTRDLQTECTIGEFYTPPVTFDQVPVFTGYYTWMTGPENCFTLDDLSEFGPGPLYNLQFLITVAYFQNPDDSLYYRVVALVSNSDGILFFGYESAASPFDCTEPFTVSNEILIGDIGTEYTPPIDVPAIFAKHGLAILSLPFAVAYGGSVTIIPGECECKICCDKCGEFIFTTRIDADEGGYREFDYKFDAPAITGGSCLNQFGTIVAIRSFGDVTTITTADPYATLGVENIGGCKWVFRTKSGDCCILKATQTYSGCPVAGIENWTVTTEGSGCDEMTLTDVQPEPPTPLGPCASCTDAAVTFTLQHEDFPLQLAAYCLWNLGECRWHNDSFIYLRESTLPLPAPTGATLIHYSANLEKLDQGDGTYRFFFTLIIRDNLGGYWIGRWRSRVVDADACPEDVLAADWELFGLDSTDDAPPSPISIVGVTAGDGCQPAEAECVPVDCATVTGTCNEAGYSSLIVDLNELDPLDADDCWPLACEDELPGSLGFPTGLLALTPTSLCTTADATLYEGNNTSSVNATVTRPDSTSAPTDPYILRVYCDATLIWEGCISGGDEAGDYTVSMDSPCQSPCTIPVTGVP